MCEGISRNASRGQQAVDLFIVRHGERADEAVSRAYVQYLEKIPKEKQKHVMPMLPIDSIDPQLTAKGHLQAYQSFSQLLPALEGRKVAVFCSPLRRAVGTALMMGSVAANRKVSKHFKHDPNLPTPP